MGKRIIAQRRGKGSPAFKTPSFRYKGEAKTHVSKERAIVMDIISSQSHSAPLAHILYPDNTSGLTVAADGLKVGTEIIFGEEAKIGHGNVLPLKLIPEGTPIFNIEIRPGDGGKLVRSTGLSAKVFSKSKDVVIITLPSKKQKKLHPDCNATIGVVSGGGRVDKPFLKAGNKFYAMKARNKYWPSVSASAMNAVAHPFGNKRSLRKSKAKPAPKNAPPGRKVGMIRPRQSGRRRGKRV